MVAPRMSPFQGKDSAPDSLAGPTPAVMGSPLGTPKPTCATWCQVLHCSWVLQGRYKARPLLKELVAGGLRVRWAAGGLEKAQLS